MLFLNRKPGEHLVLDTPSGRITIELLADQKLGVAVPPGVEVLKDDLGSSEPSTTAGPKGSESWLPARPSWHH